MNLERGKAKIKIESCVGKKTSSFLQNFKTAVNGGGREEQHGSNWLNAEEFHVVWFWKWNWFFLSSKLYPRLKNMLWQFLSDFFVTQLCFWPFLFPIISPFAAFPEDTKSFPECTLPVVMSSRLKCSRIKCISIAEIPSAREAHAGVLTRAPGCLYKSWKLGVLTRKSLTEVKGQLTTWLDFF